MAEKDFDLLSWLETGTTATREVDIYIDHAAYQELVEVEAEQASLEAELAEARESALTLHSAGRIEELAEQITALETAITAASAALVASKMVWTVRALSDTEISASIKAVPLPKAPLKPEGYLNDKVLAKLQNQAHAYAAAKVAADKARKIWMVAEATVAITTTSGTKTGITVGELERLLDRPHGAMWLNTVYDAVEAATSQEAAPSVP